MFSPIALLKDLWSERKYLSDVEKAEEYFQQQADSLKDIKNTRGYQEIVRYWQREREASINRLSEIEASNPEKVARLQAKVDQAKQFLMFLENMVG